MKLVGLSDSFQNPGSFLIYIYCSKPSLLEILNAVNYSLGFDLRRQLVRPKAQIASECLFYHQEKVMCLSGLRVFCELFSYNVFFFFFHLLCRLRQYQHPVPYRLCLTMVLGSIWAGLEKTPLLGLSLTEESENCNIQK